MDRIDKYIERERQIEHSEGLEQRVMCRIEEHARAESRGARVSKSSPLVRAAVVVSFAMSVVVGVVIGKSYRTIDHEDYLEMSMGDDFLNKLTAYIDQHDNE